MQLLASIVSILFGLLFVAAGLWDRREAEKAEQDLIERWNLLGGGIYVTRERVRREVVFFLTFGVILLLAGILFLLI